MLLSDWLLENLKFTELINAPNEEIEPTLINYILITEHGRKVIHEPFESLAGLEVAQFVNMRYNNKWIKIDEYLKNDFDIGVVNSKDITENFDGTISINQTGQVTNKESTFNTDEFVNKDNQDNELQNENVNVNTRDRQEKYKSYYTANKQIQNLNNESLAEIIVNDIVNELCLKIY